METTRRTLDQLTDLEAVLANRPWTVLMIEDEQEHADAARAILQSAAGREAIGALELVHAPSVTQARQLLRERRFDLLIVDWHVGPESGVDLIAELRAQGHMTPAIMLTTDARLGLALDTGADDFVRKVAIAEELLPRVNARLRRDAVRRRLSYGSLVIDFGDRSATFDGRRLRLTEMELMLLAYLAAREAAPVEGATHVTLAELLEKAWGYKSAIWSDGVCRVQIPPTRPVDTCLTKLRRAMEAAGAPSVIEPVKKAMSKTAAESLALSPEDRERARELTRGWRFLAAAALAGGLSARP